MKHHFLNKTLPNLFSQTGKWLNHAFYGIIFIAALAPTASEASTCSTAASNVTFNGLDKNLVFSASGQNFPSVISYIGPNGSNVWNINVKGSSADFDPKTRDISNTNVSGAPWENPVWPNANGIWFDGVYPDELMDFEFTLTRVSGTDPLELFIHTGESLDDEKDTITTTGSNWILGQYGNMTETPNLSGKTATFEDNGLAKGVDTGVGFWEISTIFTANSGTVSWNYDNTDSDMSFRATNMLAFEAKGVCSSSVTDLICSPGYQLESWPASSSGGTTFDSTNNLLRLTASKNFTNSTHPGIAGIRTSTSNGEQTETLSLSYLDSSVSDVESFRILVYDLDSETASDQDYAYISTGGSNLAVYSIGSNVEKHPSILNAYRAVLLSGGGSGADEPYHAGFVDVGVANNTSYTLASGYTGSGSESFVGYQACVKTTTPTTYTPGACGVPGFLETFGSGVGRSPVPASAQTNYDYDEGAADTNNGAIVMDDQYTVLDKSSIPGAGDWWIVDDDHTGDTNGRMLLVNADYFVGEFYRHSITGLQIGKKYSFAAYIANAEGDTEVRIPVNVKFSLESAGSEIAFVETGDILQDPGRDELAWKKYELQFTATNTNVDIVLVNNIGGGMGNDLVIDDISISEVCPPVTANISGTIFEDVNYGGGAGRDYTTANTSFSSLDVGTEATVELWESDGSICTGSAPLQTTTSNAVDGSYSFNNVTGNNFCIRVVNSTVQSNRSKTNWMNTIIPVQTYRTESTDGAGNITTISNEVGGRSPLDADVAAGNFDNSGGDGSITQSWSVVNISGGDVSGIDFGFNFDTVVNNNDSGQGSLRQFITNTNTLGGTTTLAQAGRNAAREASIFMLPNGTNYPGSQSTAGNAFTSGVASIELQSELPDIFRSKVDIDALTQNGASCGNPVIELDGSSAGTGTTIWGGTGTSGINIRSDDHFIRGLIINRFAANGIELFRDAYPSASDSSDNTHIECNWIGLDSTGTAAQGNGTGIGLWGMNSFVGNGSTSGRNVISGNTQDGISYGGDGGLDNTIDGNFIGTDHNGNTAVGNGRHGIHLYNTNGTSNNTIARIEHNTIAFNGHVGIALARTLPSASNIRFKQNSIHSNGDLGIDLVSSGMDAPQGVTTNDSQDVDNVSLPNGLQNFPVISTATLLGTDVDISGTIDAKASTNFEIELYSNQTCNADASGTASVTTYGEGEKYLTTLYVTTNASGAGSFTTTLPFASMSGSYLTALMANVTPGDVEEGNTSEFSACVNVGSCTALTGEVNEAVLTPQHLNVNEKVFVASSSIADGSQQGHLRAYTIQSDGTPATTASWDAASTMTSTKRSQSLYSTNNTGQLTTFSTLDDAAFDLNTLLEKTTIIGYTLNPSYDNELYLGNRASGSMLGMISRDSSITQISNQVDSWTYLHDSGYRSFYNSTIKQRTKRALVTSNDGFLYAFDESDGDLAWGWMPRSLVSGLTNFLSFQDQESMRGHIDILDLKDSNGNYASYIIGSYKSGLGQFVLKLDSNSSSKSDLASVVWDVDEATVNALADNSPNNGKRAYFSDTAGKVYAAYIINTDSTSYLKIRSLTDTSVEYSIQLNYTATSTPYIITDYQKTNAPAAKTLYLGDSSGNIYSAPLLSSGLLDTNTSISTAINGTSVAQMNTSASSPVLYIGSAASSVGGYYLRAQSEDRLTVFKYVSSQWQKQWTAYTTGGGKWTNGTYATDSNIASLQTSASITDEGLIVGDAIILPVSTPPSGSNCYRNAYYYLYRLSNGHFPSNRFYNSNNTAITSQINVGKGEPEALVLSDFAGGKLLGFGISDQKPDGSIGINKSLYIRDEMTTGILSWRELR